MYTRENALLSSDYKSVVDRDPFIVERQAVDPGLLCVFLLFLFARIQYWLQLVALCISQVARGTELDAGVWNYSIQSALIPSFCSIVGRRSGPLTTLASVREQLVSKLLMVAE